MCWSSPLTGFYGRSLDEVLRQQKKYEEAKDLIVLSLQIRSSTRSKFSEVNRLVELLLSAAQSNQHNLNFDFKKIKEIVKNCKKLEFESIDLAGILNKFALFYTTTRQINEARSLFNKSLDLQTQDVENFQNLILLEILLLNKNFQIS